MKIISINGQGGTGKTTVAKVLLEKFENSAYRGGLYFKFHPSADGKEADMKLSNKG